ncbi:hypothetical protein [uncultured Psychromonas sp.]|uniref:hypothetical protein n=1 Tax=uncultured Psychromonas sp. TaxID=173974 RepID=UPI00262E8942|nr:hypothetical protein [uncultured Psychromonas sp.]
MKNKHFTLISLLLTFVISISVKAKVVMITSYQTDITDLDARIISRLYTGKIIEINGISVIPINQDPSNPLRARFLQKYLSQDEDKYAAYWTVRRFIGKGTPPKEFLSVTSALDFIIETPGAIGYIDTNLLTLPKDIKIISKQ